MIGAVSEPDIMCGSWFCESDRGRGNGVGKWRGRFALKKRVDGSPEMSRVDRAGVDERVGSSIC